MRFYPAPAPHLCNSAQAPGSVVPPCRLLWKGLCCLHKNVRRPGDTYSWVLPETGDPGSADVAGKVLAPPKAGERSDKGGNRSKSVPEPQQREEQA